MKKLVLLAVIAVMVVAATVAIQAEAKLPKCSMTMCRAVNCSPDVLCVSGAHVRTCADVCNSR
jgi:hypothetical protein